MAAGRASFEIQVMRESGWVTEEIVASEELARAALKAKAAKAYVKSLRILKNWERADGSISESVIHTENVERIASPASIAPIEEAPYCKSIPDYYQLDSRSTINRLLRKYIDTVFLTPTEILHNYKALQRIQDDGSLFPAAVDRVAALQAKASGEDAKTRREEIYSAVSRIAQRARKAENHAGLPALKGNDVVQLLRQLEKVVPPEEVRYYGLVILSSDLATRRDWLAKLDGLVKLIPASGDSDALSLLDGFFADLMGVPSLIQDILGQQQDLAQALSAIADLCDGRFDVKGGDGGEQVGALCPLLAQGMLPETRKSLVERLLRQVAGGQPLSRIDPSKEREAFRRVAGRLFLADGLLGGPDMAAALTRRFVSLQEGGGLKALRESVAGVSTTLQDAVWRTVYLTQLAESPLREDLKTDIRLGLRTLLGVGDLTALFPKSRSIRDRLLQMTKMHDILEAATGLAAEDQKTFCARIDHLLVSFLAHERIIEKLDDPTATLRDRATRLIEFCGARVLPPHSRAQSLARERAVEILKQPNFEVKFIEGINDPVQREDWLRRLRTMLVRGGFG